MIYILIMARNLSSLYIPEKMPELSRADNEASKGEIKAKHYGFFKRIDEYLIYIN